MNLFYKKYQKTLRIMQTVKNLHFKTLTINNLNF